MSVIVNRGSKYFRGTRINLESMLRFDNSKLQRVEVDNPRLRFTINDSFSIHYKFANISGTSFRMLISSRDNITLSARKGYELRITDSHIEFVIVHDGANYGLVSLDFTGQTDLKSVTAFFNASTRRVGISVNGGVFKEEAVSAAVTNITPTDPLRIGGLFITGEEYAYNGYGCHAIFFNKALTFEESRDLHYEGGLVPTSAHENCVAHYTLTHRQGKKAYDSVEQYNYAKTTAITAIHGDLINYTDAECGIPNIHEQTVWKELHSKINISNRFLRLDNIDAWGQVSGITNYTTPDNWILILEFLPSETGTDYSAFFSNQITNVGSPWANAITISFNNTGSALALYVRDSAGSTVYGVETATTWTTPKKPCHVILAQTRLNDGNYQYVHSINGGNINYGSSNASRCTTFEAFTVNQDRKVSTRYSGSAYSSLSFIPNVKLNQDIAVAIYQRGVDKYDPLFNIDFSRTKEITSVKYAIDKKGSYDLQLNNYHYEEEIFQVKSNLPEPVKALRLDKSKSQYLSVANFNPTKEKGYTVIIGFATDSNRNFGTEGLWGKRDTVDTTRGFFMQSYNATKDLNYYNGISNNTGDKTESTIVNGNQTLHKPVFITSIIYSDRVEQYLNGVLRLTTTGTIRVGFDEVLNDLHIGWQGGSSGWTLDGYLCFFGVWKGTISKRTNLKIINNTLLSNPSPKDLENCELLPNLNKIINDSGIYKLQDLSPKNRTITLHNYDVNDVDPVHANYKLKPLNDLR